VDCEAGRRLGCRTFCCRLLVRLTEEERARGVPGVEPAMGCVPKDADGYCIHFDRKMRRCGIWDQRPRVCRDYNCNNDGLLQVVLRRGFTSLTDLVTAASISKAVRKLVVPRLDEKC